MRTKLKEEMKKVFNKVVTAYHNDLNIDYDFLDRQEKLGTIVYFVRPCGSHLLNVLDEKIINEQRYKLDKDFAKSLLENNTKVYLSNKKMELKSIKKDKAYDYLIQVIAKKQTVNFSL